MVNVIVCILFICISVYYFIFTKHNNVKHHECSRISKAAMKILVENVEECLRRRRRFSCIYSHWLGVRQNCLGKLRTLEKKVHDHQLKLNVVKYACKELGFYSRSIKTCTNSDTLNFWGSLGAFFSEAGDGVTAVVQAINIDSHKTKFEKIMKKDSEVTERLYKARSQCVAKYRGVEEIIRKFESVTFDSTVNKVCESLNIDKYRNAIKNAYKNDDMSLMMCTAANWINNTCTSETVEEIGASVKNCVDDNPAILEACKAVGRAAFHAVDSWIIDKTKNSVVKYGSQLANNMMMLEDRREANRLRDVINGNASQAVLETQIQQAIDYLQFDMEEMCNSYSVFF